MKIIVVFAGYFNGNNCTISELKFKNNYDGHKYLFNSVYGTFINVRFDKCNVYYISPNNYYGNVSEIELWGDIYDEKT